MIDLNNYAKKVLTVKLTSYYGSILKIQRKHDDAICWILMSSDGMQEISIIADTYNDLIMKLIEVQYEWMRC